MQVILTQFTAIMI